MTTLQDASLKQLRALQWLPKVPSLFSFLGSCYIVFDIWRIKQRNTYHRILLGMNIFDILSLAGYFATTWPVPSEVDDIPGASGNQGTCSAQGFFIQLSISTVLYNACLALYFMVVIRFGWTEAKIKSTKLEWGIHIVSSGIGIVSSCVALGLELYNPTGWFCWIAAWPPMCLDDDSDISCDRGDNANYYQWLLFYLPLWISIILATGALYQVYAAFRQQNRVVQHWRQKLALFKTSRTKGGNSTTADLDETQQDQTEQEQNEPRHRRSSIIMAFSMRTRKPQRKRNAKSRLVTSQALLYCFAFYLAWFFPSLLRIQESVVDHGLPLYHWVLLSGFFIPLQGVLNFIVYLRPKYIQIRLLKKRIAALAKQQDERLRHQQLQMGDTAGTGQVSQDLSDSDNYYYGRTAQMALIDESSSLAPLPQSEGAEASIELNMDDLKNDVDENQNKRARKQGLQGWNQESINQLHASFAGNLSFPRFKSGSSTHSAGANGSLRRPSNSTSRRSIFSSVNTNTNTNSALSFNESLNLEQLEDLTEEEGEEEDDDADDSTYNNEELNMHDYEDHMEDNEDYGIGSEENDAVESLFDAMTLHSGASLENMPKANRGRRGTLKRSNSSEFNFASMRSVKEEIQVNPQLMERFNQSMNIGSDGRVLKKRPKNKGPNQPKTPADGSSGVQYDSRNNKKRMAADQNPMVKSIPLTIGMTEHVDTSGDVAIQGGLGKSDGALYTPQNEDTNDDTNEPKSEGKGLMHTGSVYSVKRVSFDAEETADCNATKPSLADNNNSNTEETSQNEERTEEEEYVEDISSHSHGQEKETEEEEDGDYLADRRRARRSKTRTHHRPARRVETDPDKLKRMQAQDNSRDGRDGKSGVAAAPFRRNLTAPTSSPPTRLVSHERSSAPGHLQARMIRRVSGPRRLFNSLRRSGSRESTSSNELPSSGAAAAAPAGPLFSRTATHDSTLSGNGDDDGGRRRQMMAHAKGKWASKKFKAIHSFARNVKDAIKADDLSEWAELVNKLEMDISSNENDNIENGTRRRRNRRSRRTGGEGDGDSDEEEKQEIQAKEHQGCITSSRRHNSTPPRERSCCSETDIPKPMESLERAESSPVRPQQERRIPRRARIQQNSQL